MDLNQNQFQPTENNKFMYQRKPNKNTINMIESNPWWTQMFQWKWWRQDWKMRRSEDVDVVLDWNGSLEFH